MARIKSDNEGNVSFKSSEYIVKSKVLNELAVDLCQKRPSRAPVLRARISLLLSELTRKALHVSGGSFQLGDGMIRDYLGPHDGYATIKYLRERGILIRVDKAIAGARCDSYRVCDAMLVSKPAEYVMKKFSPEHKRVEQTISKITAFHASKRDQDHKDYAEGLTAFRYDPTECKEVLAGIDSIKPGSLGWIAQAMVVRDHNESYGARGRYVRLSVGSTGRVYHPACTMKEDLRKRALITFEDTETRVRALDIKASQPTILAALLKHVAGLGPKHGILSSDEAQDRLKTAGGSDLSHDPSLDPIEVRNFVFIIENGDIYDYLRQQAGEIEGWAPARSTAKTSFLRDVVAKRGHYEATDIELAFKTNFPSIYSYIRRVNKNSHSRLIRMLQWAESEIVFRYVWRKVVDKTGIPLMTVHDGFYCHRDAAEDLVLTVEEASRMIGVQLRLVDSADGRDAMIERRNNLEDIRRLLNG